MSGLELIVETPRGGNAGHVFLTSSKNVRESGITRVASAASDHPDGPTYLSASHQVKQRLANGTVREGLERIILSGVDVDKLRPEQVERVRFELTERLARLDGLIESMEWTQVGQSTVVLSEILRHWLDDSSTFRQLPVLSNDMPNEKKNPALTNRSAIRWIWVVGALLVILLIASLFAGLPGTRRGPKQDGSGPGTGKAASGSESASEQVEKLACEWNCSREDVVQSLLRAKNWDRRGDAKTLTFEDGARDGDVWEMLKQLKTASEWDKYFLSPSIDTTSGFTSFVKERTKDDPSPKNVLTTRKWLYETRKCFMDVRTKAVAASTSLQALNADYDDSFLATISWIKNYEPEVGFLDDSASQVPKTPIFDRQDFLTYRVLEAFRHHLFESGHSESPEDGRQPVKPNDNLLSFLKRVQSRQGKITRDIEESRKIAIDKIVGTPDVNAAAVKGIYISLENLYRQLSEN